MPKRLQNQLYVGYPLGTLKNTIFDVKTSPRWTPKISVIFTRRPQILAITVFGPRCLLETSKSLPRASQELSKGPQEAPKSLQEAPMQPPRGFRKGGLLDVHVTAFGTTHLKWNAYVSAV